MTDKSHRLLLFAKSAICFLSVLAAPLHAGWELRGSLSTSAGNFITDDDYRALLQRYIPASSERFHLLLQCYGGNFAQAFNSTQTDWGNTLILSATSRDQKAIYGGFDDDAISALRPGLGRTAQYVWVDGLAGKHPTETPIRTGGLSNIDFTLAPTDPVGAFGPASRQVVFYAGKPDTTAGRDIDQRNTLLANFGVTGGATTTTGASGTQFDTRVFTAGGKPHPSDPVVGTNGFRASGSFGGLATSILQAGTHLANSTDPAHSQFIFVAGDHGSYDVANPRYIPIHPLPLTPGGLGVRITTDELGNPDRLPLFSTLGPRELEQLRTDMIQDLDNRPGFSAFVDFSSSGSAVPFTNPSPFSASDWSLIVSTADGTQSFNLVPTLQDVLEFQSVRQTAQALLAGTINDGIGIITPPILSPREQPTAPPLLGDEQGEGVQLFFEMDEAPFLALLGQDLELTLLNNTAQTYQLGNFRAHSGAIAKVPEPDSAAIVLGLGLLTTVPTRRRAIPSA